MTSDDQNLEAMYRRASRETSPQHVDRAILAMAKKTRPRSWQPFALAATVLLSFAFIVNIGMLQPDVPSASVGSAMEGGLKKTADEQLPAQSTPEPDASRTPPARERQLPAARSLAPQADAISVPESPNSAAALARVMEDLQENSQTSDRASGYSTEARQGEKNETPRYCSEAASASAGSWYRCVLELREAGLEDQAEYEQALLQTKFPDFELR